jgi:hypothetical protein
MLKLESELNDPVRSKCSGGITGDIQYNGYYRFSTWNYSTLQTNNYKIAIFYPICYVYLNV